MKKPQNKTPQRRKLIIRREIIVSLTPLQLSNANAANGSDPSDNLISCGDTFNLYLPCP